MLTGVLLLCRVSENSTFSGHSLQRTVVTRISARLSSSDSEWRFTNAHGWEVHSKGKRVLSNVRARSLNQQGIFHGASRD